MKKPTPKYDAFTAGLKSRRSNIPLIAASTYPAHLRAAWIEGWKTEDRFITKRNREA